MGASLFTQAIRQQAEEVAAQAAFKVALTAAAQEEVTTIKARSRSTDTCPPITRLFCRLAVGGRVIPPVAMQKRVNPPH